MSHSFGDTVEAEYIRVRDRIVQHLLVRVMISTNSFGQE